MINLAALLWLSLALIFYTYIGYPSVLVALLALKGRRVVRKARFFPHMSLLVTVHDEEETIALKLENCLSLDYPRDKLQILVTSDGSDDGTVERVRAYAQTGVELNVIPDRIGKMGAILDAMPKVRGEVVVFSDATALFEPGALQALACNFADPDVGGVSGTLKLMGGAPDSGLQVGESVYWRYESMLRRLESDLGSTIVAPGSIYAVRTGLFRAPAADTIADDLAITFGILAQGRRMVVDECAVATERISTSLAGEFDRKVRIVAGGIQTLIRFRHMLVPTRARALISFQLVSHKLFRWLVPFAMLGAFATSLTFAFSKAPDIEWKYVVIFACQAFFYSLALIGRLRPGLRLCDLAFHFCAINAAVVVGWMRLLSKSQPSAWNKTEN